jgi:molybdopterin molybdotransferase
VAAELIEISEARRLVLERASALPIEEVPLGEALGRVLGADVESVDPVPAFVNSAMDGFAVRAADTGGAQDTKPARLRISGESRAGHPAAAALAPGEAIRISTGAVLPEGADAVVRVEDTSTGEGQVEVRVAAAEGENVRQPGEDIPAGEVVLRRGTALGAAELGVLASVGRTGGLCARRPRTTVLTTGDELQAPDEAPRPGGVRNSNAYSVPALALGAGAEVVRRAMVRDDRAEMAREVEGALEGDVVIITGGVSVGEHDHVRPTLSGLGVEQVFWGVAMRPGKPTWFGVHRGGALVFGLPGNPVSAMVAFLLFTRPAIRAMLGAAAERDRATAILDDDYEKRRGRTHAVRCRMELRDDGWHVRPTRVEQGSHVLTSMVGAEALAMMPAEVESVGAGERVEIEIMPGGWERWQ